MIAGCPSLSYNVLSNKDSTAVDDNIDSHGSSVEFFKFEVGKTLKILKMLCSHYREITLFNRISMFSRFSASRINDLLSNILIKLIQL